MDRAAARELGIRAEDEVARRLTADGWNVIVRNWRGAQGEIDLVAGRAGALRFVEVKARVPDDPVGLESIDGWKRSRLTRAARAWLADWNEPYTEACFLVVLVEPTATGLQLTFVDNAFDVNEAR